MLQNGAERLLRMSSSNTYVTSGLMKVPIFLCTHKRYENLIIIPFSLMEGKILEKEAEHGYQAYIHTYRSIHGFFHLFLFFSHRTSLNFTSFLWGRGTTNKCKDELSKSSCSLVSQVEGTSRVVLSHGYFISCISAPWTVFMQSKKKLLFAKVWERYVCRCMPVCLCKR